MLSQETLEGYLADFYRKAGVWDYVVAGAFPGFKDIYEEAGVAAETRYLDPRDGETFGYTLRLALEQKPDVIQLITWNDYGETTGIEPTEEFGYQYLEMVQDARREPMETSPTQQKICGYRCGYSPCANNIRVKRMSMRMLDQVFEAILAGDLDQARNLSRNRKISDAE